VLAYIFFIDMSSKIKVKIGSNAPEVVPKAEWGTAWPFDLQCVLRLPADVADRIAPLIKSGASAQGLVQVTPLSETIKGEHHRKFRVRVLDEVLEGVLIDLPTYVESYKTADGNNFTKSADVSQMLVVSRGTIDERGLKLQADSGITPPTYKIRQRRFRPPVKTADANLSKAESAILSIVGGGTLEWSEETEVSVHEQEERYDREPMTIWTPTEDVLDELFQKGHIDQDGNLLEDVEEDEEAEDDGGEEKSEPRSSQPRKLNVSRGIKKVAFR